MLVHDERADKAGFTGCIISTEQSVFVLGFENDLSANELGALIGFQKFGICFLCKKNTVLSSVARLACKLTWRHMKIATNDAIYAQLVAGVFKFLGRTEILGLTDGKRKITFAIERESVLEVLHHWSKSFLELTKQKHQEENEAKADNDIAPVSFGVLDFRRLVHPSFKTTAVIENLFHCFFLLTLYLQFHYT